MKICKKQLDNYNQWLYIDLFVTLTLLLGLLCIFFAWYKLTNLAYNIGINPTTLPQHIREAFINNLKILPIINMNFFAYFFSVIFGTGKQIIVSQQKEFEHFLTNIFINFTYNAKGEIMTNCMTQSPNNYFNIISDFVITIFSPRSMYGCVIQTPVAYIQFQINLYQIRLASNINTITSLTYYGASLTYASICYVSYRTGLVKIKNSYLQNKNYITYNS